MDLLIGQLEEGGVLLWADAVRAELVQSSEFLLGACRESHPRLQRGSEAQCLAHGHVSSDSSSTVFTLKLDVGKYRLIDKF